MINLLKFKTIGIVALVACTLAFGVFQNWRINSFKNQVASLKEENLSLKTTIKVQEGMIVELQGLVNKNEEAFKDYVKGTSKRIDILKGIKTNDLNGPLESIDKETSEKIKKLWVDEFEDLKCKLR